MTNNEVLNENKKCITKYFINFWMFAYLNKIKKNVAIFLFYLSINKNGIR